MSFNPSVEAQAINAAFDNAGVGFKAERADVLEQFKAGGERTITFDEEGQPFSKYDGQILPLNEALHRFGHDRKDLVDRRTLPREDAGKGRPGVASKADFTTLREKTAFIAEHGLTAYEKLPLTAPVSQEIRFKEDFFKLPLSQKTELLKKDADYLNNLPNRPRNTALKIDPAKIDRHKSAYQRSVEAAQRAELGLEGVI